MKILVIGMVDHLNKAVIANALSNTGADIVFSDDSVPDKSPVINFLGSGLPPAPSKLMEMINDSTVPDDFIIPCPCYTEPRKSKGDKRRDRADRRRKGWL